MSGSDDAATRFELPTSRQVLPGDERLARHRANLIDHCPESSLASSMSPPVPRIAANFDEARRASVSLDRRPSRPLHPDVPDQLSR